MSDMAEAFLRLLLLTEQYQLAVQFIPHAQQQQQQQQQLLDAYSTAEEQQQQQQQSVFWCDPSISCRLAIQNKADGLSLLLLRVVHGCRLGSAALL